MKNKTTRISGLHAAEGCIRSWKLRVRPVLAAAGLLVGSAAPLCANDMAFKVEVMPTGTDTFEIRVHNQSREQITGLVISMDGTDHEFERLVYNSVTRSADVLEPEYLADDTGLIREAWVGISGNSIDNLLWNTVNLSTTPDSRIRLSGLVEAPVDAGDSYGQRIHGYLIPPTTGRYRFWIASDDNGLLSLSTDENPANLVDIASVPGHTSPNEWTKYTQQASGWRSLVAGQRYYMRALMKEGGGQDNLSVGWQRESDNWLERPMSARWFSTKNSSNVELPGPAFTPAPSDTIRMTNIGGLTTGNTIAFRGKFTAGPANAAAVLFNNGISRMNAKVTVFGAGGGRSELEMTDTASNQPNQWYEFLSETRPRRLQVVSRVQGTDEHVPNFQVRVYNKQGALIEEQIEPPGDVVVDYLTDGSRVDIRAVEAVYRTANGTFLYDSTDIPTEDELDPANPPRQRFVTTGLSVNNTPQTGDPTQYTFDISADSEVNLRWRHDFALLVRHDFGATESDERTPTGEPWAGPLTSGASGNPSPGASMINWIPRGESVLAQIDGQLNDFTRPGLDIRYVPVGYLAQGSARGVFTEQATYHKMLNVGQAPPQRQQVDAFIMDGWGSLEYVWQIQYGIRVNVDDPSRAALPRVFRINASGSPIEIGALEGVFWFNPNDQVVVATAANVSGPSSQALSGWLSGDGFYFSSSGDISSNDGSLLNGGPLVTATGPVALWNPAFMAADGRTYRGLNIPQLRRPARVLWTYGSQVYLDTVNLGEFLYQAHSAFLLDKPELAETIRREPDEIRLITVDGANPNVAASELVVWDDNAKRLYPVVPGQYRAIWNLADGQSVQVLITALYPETEHYPHIVSAPDVQLNPEPVGGSFRFKTIAYSENEAGISDGSLFSVERAGRSVLVFAEVAQIGRGEPQEFVRVRVVHSRLWDEISRPEATVVIGRRIEDAELDLARLGTGYVMFEKARYNGGVYDAAALAGLRARDVYDMDLLLSTTAEKVVVNRSALPGPVIPVNLHPGAQSDERIVVAWYADPALTDSILWPHAVRTYLPRWPLTAAEGLGRIVIASQFGSESVDAAGQDQLVAPEVVRLSPDGEGGIVTNVFPALTTYDPSRLQQAQVYVQDNPDLPGYNPNEEHALMAPSRRFAQVSPRPLAAYALRNNDLNRCNPDSVLESAQGSDYTSHPRVLVQYFDTAADEFAMRVYSIQKEDPYIAGYRFVNQSLVTPASEGAAVSASPQLLVQEPYVRMEAGEPVIPFYPLGVVIGATPSPETFGVNIKGQATYWEDHKGTSWAVSGGENAWFTFSIYYPLNPGFWWPESQSGRIRYVESTRQRVAAVVNVGDSVAFMPATLNRLQALNPGTVVSAAIDTETRANRILYKSDWPAVAPVLKAGETLTYSGGEFRQDHPNSLVVNANGTLSTVPTPGLPGVLGFAVGEVVFDALNPQGRTENLRTSWTVRMAQVLDVRSVPLAIDAFPTELLPASGRTRVSGGKYVFNDLPASLQKRLRFDPLAQSRDENGSLITGRLEITGLINEKAIGDNTLTAPPPAVYVLEPNIMTDSDLEALLELVDDTEAGWRGAVNTLFHLTRNPESLEQSNGQFITGDYLVGLQAQVQRDPVTGLPLLEPIEPGSDVLVSQTDPGVPEAARQFGPGLALVPNAAFLDPLGTYTDVSGQTVPLPEVSWVTVAENNDPSMGGSPVTLHIIKVDQRERYRGAIKTVLSDNVFDENVVLRHTGEFGGNADDLVFEWWYRPDDGQLDVLPPYVANPDSAGDWKFFPDMSGEQGRGMFGILLKGNPNTPETLLADSWWFVRYRHRNDFAQDTDWNKPQPNGDPTVNFEWAGAGNNDPFNDFDLDGYPDYRAQLSMGWIKRVLDAVNPYEARIRDFEGESPSTVSSMLQQLGPRFEGPVALNPAKDVIENVGLIELYGTVLDRSASLSIDLSSPVSTPAIANALQLASTRLSDFYMLLGNEAYTDARDPTIGIGSDSVEYGALAPVVHSFQNQMSTMLEEELALLRGVNNYFARPVYNRLFWNFTKGEGEAAYAVNYNVTDINKDGFIDEDDSMILYPMGHGDAWGHYLTAVRKQYDLLRHPYFNWVSRSEFYNLMDIVIPVDFLDERKFAQAAAARARTGAEIVTATYRQYYVEDPAAQWQGYIDVEPDRAWGVQGWARRTGQGAYFDWITANALLPSQHPNTTLEGIQKVDRQSNEDIRVVSANLNSIQQTFDDANSGLNPLRLASAAVPFDINPQQIEDIASGRSHFQQMYDRAVVALNNAKTVWDYANESQNRLRQVANTEAAFRNEVFQENATFNNRLIDIFGRPYDGTVGPGRIYPAGYAGPDIALYMYVDVLEISNQTVPGPSLDFATFDNNGVLSGGDLLDALETKIEDINIGMIDEDDVRMFASSFISTDGETASVRSLDGSFSLNYTDLDDPKIPLDNLAQLMPVKASGYSFQAPQAWGSRPAVGELQMVINEMVRQEAEIARAIGAWDSAVGDIVGGLRMLNATEGVKKEIRKDNKIFVRTRYVVSNIIKAITAGMDIADAAGEQVQNIALATKEIVPKALPTAGLAISPGDAAAPARGAIQLTGAITKAGISGFEIALKIAAQVAEITFEIAEKELELKHAAMEDRQALREALSALPIDGEPLLRIEIFKEIEALRALSDRYRSLVTEGARLIDERAAFNKRVAAMTQQNRYQDMTFRVHRNHALEVYDSAFELAARYAYLASKAYDYETNFDPSDPGSPASLFPEIVKARSIGLVQDGMPQRGSGLANVLATLNANFDALQGQLGFNNPQTETGKISLRTEWLRILPSGNLQPVDSGQFPGGGQDADVLWRQALQGARVDNLWDVDEYRYFARPFASDLADGGNPAVEPGIVLRFGTTITAGKNVFGHPLSGGDHAYDPSLFATKVRSVGVWFSDYLSDDVLNDLPQAPRVYLIPVGSDIMSIANSPTPDKVRIWNVVDQLIPVPYAALGSSLQYASYRPLLDSLNGRIGTPRRFSSFRAYHDSGTAVDLDEMVFDSRLIGRSVWNTEWLLIIPGRTFNADPDEGLDRFINQVKDIKLVFQTYGHPGN